MHKLNAGEILGLLGFGLLMLHKLILRQAKKDSKPARGLYLLWLRWGDMAAFLTILAGLVLMYFLK